MEMDNEGGEEEYITKTLLLFTEVLPPLLSEGVFVDVQMGGWKSHIYI